MLPLLPDTSQQVKIIFLTYLPVDTIKSPQVKIKRKCFYPPKVIASANSAFIACTDIYDSSPSTERIILDQALDVKVHSLAGLTCSDTHKHF